MAIKAYRLKVVRDGFEFDAEGDKAFVLEMLKRFSPTASAGSKSDAKLSNPPSIKSAIPALTLGKATSIREFVQQLGLKKHTDISLAFGYYLEKYTGVTEFTPADITSCYYEAKLETSNTSQMIIQNIKRGYLMVSKKKKGEKGRIRYTLTASGEKFIESKFPKG